MKKIIAFQGSQGANSNLACSRFYPEFEAQAFASFVEVFKAVESGAVQYGMIPLENSSAGRVSEIHDLLQEHFVSIIAEHFVAIEHFLAAKDGVTLSDIKKVYSHPQALMQCKNNLRSLGLELCDFSNTAEAAKFVASQDDKSKAALCSKVAAEINGLKIVKDKMLNSASRFLSVVGRSDFKWSDLTKFFPRNFPATIRIGSVIYLRSKCPKLLHL